MAIIHLQDQGQTSRSRSNAGQSKNIYIPLNFMHSILLLLMEITMKISSDLCTREKTNLIVLDSILDDKTQSRSLKPESITTFCIGFSFTLTGCVHCVHISN